MNIFQLLALCEMLVCTEVSWLIIINVGRSGTYKCLLGPLCPTFGRCLNLLFLDSAVKFVTFFYTQEYID